MELQHIIYTCFYASRSLKPNTKWKFGIFYVLGFFKKVFRFYLYFLLHLFLSTLLRLYIKDTKGTTEHQNSLKWAKKNLCQSSLQDREVGTQSLPSSVIHNILKNINPFIFRQLFKCIFFFLIKQEFSISWSFLNKGEHTLCRYAA